MANEPNEPWYNPNAELVDNAIEYSILNISEPSEGLVINQGSIILNPDFNEFDTHVYMCYEYSDCQLLEPESSNNNDLYGCLVSREMEELEEEES
jgi:hypothetical protein